MSSCKKCGKCCEVIPLAYSYYNIIAMRNNSNKSFDFAARNFIPISKEQAFKINPSLNNGNTNYGYFYKCKKYDDRTKTCMVYPLRPATCSEYPYLMESTIIDLIYPDCTFQKDITLKKYLIK